MLGLCCATPLSSPLIVIFGAITQVSMLYCMIIIAVGQALFTSRLLGHLSSVLLHQPEAMAKVTPEEAATTARTLSLSFNLPNRVILGFSSAGPLVYLMRGRASLLSLAVIKAKWRSVEGESSNDQWN
jgi:hypothetical protein